MKKINLFLLTGIVFLSSCVVKKIKVYEENQAIKFLDETKNTHQLLEMIMYYLI